MFRLGVIINPYAGLGGTVALKGSDGKDTRNEALKRGALPRAMERMQRALQLLLPRQDDIHIYCFSGEMGEVSVAPLGFEYTVVGDPITEETRAEDTRAAAQKLLQTGVDIIIFAGGDGTARIIADAIDTRQPVLGVPCGVKMHSGVYAITPEAAGKILLSLMQGKLLVVSEQAVKDIDEDAFRAGQVRAKFYGSLLVPEEPMFLQQVKNSGAQVDEMAQIDIAHDVIENLQEDTLYIVGPGSTTHVLLEELGLQGTLLGVDVLLNRKLIAIDVTAQEIREYLDQHEGPIKIIITAIGGQGHIIGRGNQQLTPDILWRAGKENLWVIATREKIIGLERRPLLIDSHDPLLDQAFSGFIQVTTGYRERVLYPVGINE